MERPLKIIANILIMCLVASPVFAALENLDESLARKTRLATAPWSRGLLEGASPTYLWQPETLNYTDQASGSEIWRLSYTPTRRTATQDIGTAHWSADGKRLAILSDRQNAARSTAAANEYTWFTMLTDGSKLRPAIDSSNYNAAWSMYPAWSPITQDLFYAPGWASSGGGRQYNDIYGNTVGDEIISFTSVVSVDSSSTRRLDLKKGISGDGSKLLFTDESSTPRRVFVANLPDSTLDTPTTGYSANLPWDTYWGNTSAAASWHDQYVAGTGANIWNYILQTSTNAWWRSKLIGTGTDNQPTHTQDHTSPYVWGEFEPVNTDSGNDPFGDVVSYASHFATDRWGKYAIHTKTDSPYGASLLDLSTHDYWDDAKAFSGAATWVQHHDWSAWSDWSVSSGGTGSSSDYRNQNVLAQNFTNPESQKLVVSAHSFLNTDGVYTGNGVTDTYYALVRPAQSPDGTKVMYNSTFLNSSDLSDQVYWATVYYPYPAFVRSVTATGGTVTITVDWDLEGTPRGYTIRGWPNEATDLPPPPREVEKFRLWRSTDGTAWTPIKTFNHTVWDNYDFSDGAWTGDDFWTATDTPGNGTFYYAVTSMETSGLESRKLSNVYAITVSAGSGTGSQSESYPSDPGGKTAFYTTAPSSPTAITAIHQQSPAITAGQYTVVWTAPADATMVRHYNIYAHDGSAPTATQQMRIASIPATAPTTYIDWLGNTDGSTQYLVTSVDYQGNESDGTGGDTGAGGYVATPNIPPGRKTSSPTISLTAEGATVIKYCLTTGCTPATTYSAPFKVLQNLALQTLRMQADDGSVTEAVYTKKCRKSATCK